MLMRSEIPSGMCAKLRIVAASTNRVHMPWSLCCCLFAPHMYGVVLHAHPVRGESYNQRNTTGEVATTSSPFYNEPHRSHVLLCEGWTPHDLQILATAPCCCDRKSRAACAQSFASWQQETIEFTCHDHSVIACSRHIYLCVVLHAHPVRGESHNQRNTTGEVATMSVAICWWFCIIKKLMFANFNSQIFIKADILSSSPPFLTCVKYWLKDQVQTLQCRKTKKRLKLAMSQMR